MIAIAVDGPAGSGKSTISKILADRYSLTYLDTGAMYRSCALLQEKYSLSESELAELVRNTEFRFEGKTVGQRLFLNVDGQEFEVTDEIRTPEITSKVSDVAAMSDVRTAMTEKQREIAEKDSVIIDGRDIGTVVLPDADLKIYLIATAEERARRRMLEWEGNNIKKDYRDVLFDIIKRDEIDSSRDCAPLKKADDAEEIDTTGLTIEQVITIISAKVEAVLSL